MAWRPARVGDTIVLTGLGIAEENRHLYAGKGALVTEVGSTLVYFKLPGCETVRGVQNQEDRFSIVETKEVTMNVEVGDTIRTLGTTYSQNIEYTVLEVEQRGPEKRVIWFDAKGHGGGSSMIIDGVSYSSLGGVWDAPDHYEIVKKEAPELAAAKKAATVVSCWADAEKILASGVRRVLLMGIPGTGKTFAARKSGVSKTKKVYNLYIQPETPAIDVLGHDIIRDGDMIWRDGPAIRAWRQGARLVINEIDKASEDCLDALLAICDDVDSSGFELPSGEYVEPHKDFQVIATMNGEREDLPDALQDRFAIAVNITHPHPAAIEALQPDIRELARNSSHADVEEERRISIRQFRGFDELRAAKVPDEVAARATFRHRAGDVLVALAAAKLKEQEQAKAQRAAQKAAPKTTPPAKARAGKTTFEVT